MDSFLVNHGEKLEKDEFKLLSRELNGVMERSAARFELLQSVMSTETKQSDALKTTKIKEAANKERHVDLKGYSCFKLIVILVISCVNSFN